MARLPCCAACESRTVQAHCTSPSCPWVRCLKCLAWSFTYRGKRAWRGGVSRLPGIA